MKTSTTHPWIGRYVIARCRDAGVHAGILESIGPGKRTCRLSQSRRLWYWRPADGAAFLSGVAARGLAPDSKVGCMVEVSLSEFCEIILCSDAAAASIAAVPEFRP